MSESGSDVALVGLGLIFLLWALVVVFGLAIAAVLAYFLYAPLNRLPQRYRAVESWIAWLVLVPVLNIVILWILAPFKIPESFKNYIDDPANDQDLATRFGDCGKNLGLAAAISMTCMFVPFLSMFAFFATPVLMIVYLVRINGLKSLIPEEAG
ncbi:MAG: hypothetical protein AB7O52_12475 [Planctomycetota bacterium]